jgi:hypothetical protein
VGRGGGDGGWRHNALLSILASTAVHVALATVLAGG